MLCLPIFDSTLKSIPMKHAQLVLPAFLLLFSCGSASDESAEEYNDLTNEDIEVIDEPEVINSIVISSKNVGLFSIGSEVPNLPSELKSRQFMETEVSEGEEGAELTHNVIFNQLEDVLELIMDHQMDDEHHEDKAIQEMFVMSNYYETAKGISVGSTIGEFQAAYPDASIWYSYISDRFVMETADLVDVQFFLDGADCTITPKGSSDHETIDIIDFNGGAKIQKIRVY